jgi:hypothetical protein
VVSMEPCGLYGAAHARPHARGTVDGAVADGDSPACGFEAVGASSAPPPAMSIRGSNVRVCKARTRTFGADEPWTLQTSHLHPQVSAPGPHASPRGAGKPAGSSPEIRILGSVPPDGYCEGAGEAAEAVDGIGGHAGGRPS